MNEHFPHIFSPGRVGKFETINRIKWAACCVSNYNNKDGSYSERQYERDKVISRMGCGIITNQGAYPDKEGLGKGYYYQLSINDDRFIPGLSRVAELFHASGALAIQQILHAGRYGGIDLDYCIQPSPVEQTLKHFRPPREMTVEQIHEVIEDHAQAAIRAKKAGFDGVELTAFMGYLMANFLSPFTNRRTDEWGGNAEKRGRFMVETIKAIKKSCGEDFLVFVRLNGTELMEGFGGNTDEECLLFMEMAEDAGVDLISVVIGWHESRTGALGRDIPCFGWLPVAEQAKARLKKVPIAFGPRLADPKLADKAIKEGVIDFWEICRPGLADPEIIHKVKENKLEDIRPCIGCLMCLARLFANLPYICTVNPILGHEGEQEYRVTKASRRKRVFVAGAGLAGMECALRAAERGHDVTLFERDGEIGGQLLAARREVRGGDELLRLLAYYRNQIKKSRIELQVNTELTADLCKIVRPDVVVVATGAYLKPPSIPGIHKRIVKNALQVLKTGESLSNKEVVVIGEGKSGLVTAEYYASQNNKVSILTSTTRVDHDVSPTFRWRHASWIKEFAIEVYTGVTVTEILDDAVRFVDSKGQAQILHAELVIYAGPRYPESSLLTEVEYFADEIYVAGDAIVPRGMHNAIHEGYRVGIRV